MTPERGFPDSEYESRTAQLQLAMQAASIDVVWLTQEADVRYYSGFFTQFWQSPTRPWFLCIPSIGKPVAVIPDIGAVCMARTWISDIRTWTSPHPVDDGIGLLCDVLKEFGGQRARIGTPLCRETSLRLPISEFEKIKLLMVGCEFVDAGRLLIAQRQVKSEREIEKLRHICCITSTVFTQVPEFVRVGMSEIETFRQFNHKCLSAGVDDVSYLVGGADTGGYSEIISPPSIRALQAGDVLILDTGCVWDGYFCDFDRNYLLGSDTASKTTAEDAAAAHHVVWDATEAGLEAAKPGITCGGLFDVMYSLISPYDVAGHAEAGRLGHGLGMQLTEPPSLSHFDDTVLRSGMVITLEPGYTFAPGKMMVHEENIVIRDNGAELLSKRAPRDLMIIR